MSEVPVKSTEINLLDAEIKTENDALNILVSFLGLAQSRGIFSITESAKIYECIKKFQVKKTQLSEELEKDIIELNKQ
jgi:hypothetical protein